MILDSLLAGTILFTSFAMRTPNVQPNPDDYEFSLGISSCLLYTSPSPRDRQKSRMPSSA